MMADTLMKERKQPKTNNNNNNKKTPAADGHRGLLGRAGQAVFAGDALICCSCHMMAAAGAPSPTDRQRSFPAHRLSKAAGNKPKLIIKRSIYECSD